MEVHHVFCLIGPNQVCDAYYVIENDTLTLTYRDGEPVTVPPDGRSMSAKLSPESNADAVAKVLTRKLRKIVYAEAVEGFNRVIEYPREGDTPQQRFEAGPVGRGAPADSCYLLLPAPMD